jgi:hypothetical protein
MKNEWQKFNPKDRSTHPKENSRVQMKYSDGTELDGGFMWGHFHHGGASPAASTMQTKQWRYAG